MMEITDRQALRASVDLARLAHACALDLTDAAALSAFTSAAIRYGLVEAGAGAEGAASCLVLAGCLGGSDGLEVCADHRPLAQSLCASTGPRCYAPARRLRCCARFDHEPILMQSADWLIFLGSTHGKGKRISPTEAEMVRMGIPINGLTCCIVPEWIDPALAAAIEGQSMLHDAFEFWRAASTSASALEWFARYPHGVLFDFD